MEETTNSSTETNSASPNKKRKFPAEQLDLPLPKHKSSHICSLATDSSSNAHHEELHSCLYDVTSSGRLADDASQPRSGEDSNNFSGDADSIMSISGKIKNSIWCSKASSSHDQPSTSSVKRGSHCSMKSLYSLESRAVSKSSSDEMESSDVGDERDLHNDTFGLLSSPYYEDHLLEFGGYEDYSCLQDGADNLERCTDEDLIYSNGTEHSNHVLSSGRWTANPDVEGAKNLTIDKEFEQYFSTLML